MAKLPGWMRSLGMTVVDGEVRWLVTVRRWHPGYWWYVFQTLRKVRIERRGRR